MTTLHRFKKQLLLGLGAGVLWVIQFFPLPAVFPRYFPQSNEATALLLVLPLLVSTAGTWAFRLRLTQWLPADAVYTLLILLYHGEGLYGIGLRGIRLDGAAPIYSFPLAALMTAGLLALLLLSQSAACGVRTLGQRLIQVYRHTDI